MLEERVFARVCEYNLIEKDDNIILGLSGGPDSMVLLYIFIYIKSKISFNLKLAHVNHGVRGEEALKDEIFVKEIAEKLDLEYFSTRVDMISLAKEKNISEEEAGRELRYGFFREIIKKLGHGKIAVAHNRNDQAETLIMRIMRGTGIDGLAGMDFRSGDIIRPILDIDRWEIEKYIKDKGIETVIDKTNLETIYTRNKVRLELIPYIEENFNPNIINTLFRLSENARIDSQFLEEFTEARYEQVVERTQEASIVIKNELFKEESLSIQNRILRRALLDLKGSLQGIEEIHISSIIDLFSKGQTGKGINLPDNIVARVSYDKLIIEKKSKKLKPVDPSGEDEIALKLGKNILDTYNLEIDLEILDRESVNIRRNNKRVKIFDYDKIKGDIWIRSRKPGDRFAPFGMRGSKKIKDYFIDEKIPRDLRDKIPLLMGGKNIIWVIGYRMSEKYKVDSETTSVLRVGYKNK